MVAIRSASSTDIAPITLIYNQGIEDGVATLDFATKSESEMRAWFENHDERYQVIVASQSDTSGTTQMHIVGWASLNKYSHRCAYDGVADLSIYVRREQRGCGIGGLLMEEIEQRGRAHDFHKIVLFALTSNEAGHQLYAKRGFREVGIFQEQGKLDGRYVDVLIMEKLLKKH